MIDDFATNWENTKLCYIKWLYWTFEQILISTLTFLEVPWPIYYFKHAFDYLYHKVHFLIIDFASIALTS